MKQIKGMPKKIEIGRSNAVLSAKDLLKNKQGVSRVIIITDREVAGYYLSPFMDLLECLGKTVAPVILDSGAHIKSLEGLKPIFEKFVDLEMDKNDNVFVLGGGTVIDVALFAIATFSVPIQTTVFPTTLFSMIDTGLAEKASLNFQGRKDLLSTRPLDYNVIVDTAYLNSVPAKIITNGSAQIVQYGLLMNPGLLTLLSVPKDMTHIVETAIITGQKIREHNPRWLDFGCDIADAISLHFRYYHYSPGEALALGLFASCPSSKLKSLYTRLGLPLAVEGVTRDTLMKRIEKSMRITKKGVEIVKINEGGQPYIKTCDVNEALSDYNKALNLICQ